MAPRARGDPGRRRGGAHQRLHPRPACAVRPGAVARGAGDAAGDHASAAVVSVPPVEGVVLVAHRDRAAAGADGAAARGRAIRAACRSRSCSARRRSRCATGSAGRTAPPGAGSSRASTPSCAPPSRCFPRRGRDSAHPQGGRLRHRAAERRRRAGRHLPGHRQQRDDVRHARLRAGPSRRRHRLAGGAQAAGDRGGPRLLPALPVAGLGHRPRRPRHGRGRRSPPMPPARWLRRAGRSSTWSATGRCAAPGCGPAAGRSSTPTRTTRTSTTPPWSACCCTATAIRPTPRRSTARASGSSACSPPTAAGARSSRRTPIST